MSMMHLRPPQGSRTDVFIQGLVAIASSNEAQTFFRGGSFLNAAGASRVPASKRTIVSVSFGTEAMSVEGAPVKA
jgi:hypothetical protein